MDENENVGCTPLIAIPVAMGVIIALLVTIIIITTIVLSLF